MSQSIAEKIFQNISDEEYFKIEALSHSLLSRYKNEGMKCEEPIDSNQSLLFGSLVDTMITNQKDLSSYVIIDKMTDSEADLLRDMAEVQDQKQGELTDDDLLLIANQQQWRANWKDQTRLEKLRLIYSNVKGKSGVNLIPMNMYQDAVNCVCALRNTTITNDILSCQDKTIVFQGAVISDYLGYMFRSKFDIVLIDEQNKTIYPYDLKTTSKPEYEFMYSFVKFGYDLQARIYMSLLKQRLSDLGMSDWTIKQFTFIVVNRAEPNPMLYSVDLPDMGQGNVYTKYNDILVDPIELAKLYINDKLNQNKSTRPYEWKEEKVYSLNDILKIKTKK